MWATSIQCSSTGFVKSDLAVGGTPFRVDNHNHQCLSGRVVTGWDGLVSVAEIMYFGLTQVRRIRVKEAASMLGGRLYAADV